MLSQWINETSHLYLVGSSRRAKKRGHRRLAANIDLLGLQEIIEENFDKPAGCKYMELSIFNFISHTVRLHVSIALPKTEVRESWGIAYGVEPFVEKTKLRIL